MAGRCVWQGGMHGREVCVAEGMHDRGVCVVGGHVWQGACMAGGMQGRGCMRGRRDGHCSGRYASYRNAFL